jgi:hypothetical protein
MGAAVMFKSPVGLALTAGFALVQAVQVIRRRDIRLFVPAAATLALFGTLYVACWDVPPGPEELRTILSPWFHLDFLRGHGVLAGFIGDLAWLVLPALIVLHVRPAVPEPRHVALLLFALVPLLLVNTMRTVDMRQDLGVSSMNAEDWRNLLFPVPTLLHALALGLVAQRWSRIGRGLRAAVAVVIALTVVPAAVVSTRYARLVVGEIHNAHEFVDNRSLAEALATIPTSGTMIVTNDLRYPADGFSRENRQLQIPALFGHQAFAVNYVYEAIEERRALQRLLTQSAWSDAILDAARAYHWTHLVIRKDYDHAAQIPLEQVFDSDQYEVFRFP